MQYMLFKSIPSHLFSLLIFILLPGFLHASEPSSGTLIMISSDRRLAPFVDFIYVSAKKLQA